MMEVNKMLLKIEIFIAGIIFSMMTLLVTVGAITRNFGFPIIWTSDMAQLFYIWVGFLGGDIVMKAKGHVGIDLITGFLSEKTKKIVEVFIYLAILVFLICFAWLAVQAAQANGNRTFLGLDVSYIWAIASVAAGCFLMALSIVMMLPGMLKSMLAAGEESRERPL
jgi:TRAP-type C4-dicarboxylate transport system permease small subunit